MLINAPTLASGDEFPMNSAVLWRITKQLGIYNRTQDAASRLQAEAAEILGMANELERLTKDTSSWYAGTRARVEARATLEQAEELLGEGGTSDEDT